MIDFTIKLEHSNYMKWHTKNSKVNVATVTWTVLGNWLLWFLFTGYTRCISWDRKHVLLVNVMEVRNGFQLRVYKNRFLWKKLLPQCKPSIANRNRKQWIRKLMQWVKTLGDRNVEDDYTDDHELCTGGGTVRGRMQFIFKRVWWKRQSNQESEFTFK